ncbi:MAG: hypothetical protein IJY50_09525 [Clostridia bacterium]|nr:hypothetical protein [Clostridia bacterium]
MTNKSKIAVRILAWILAIMMVVGVAYLTIDMIAQSIADSQEQTENGLDHDHDGDGKNDH